MVYNPEFRQIEKYRELLVNQKIKKVDFTEDADEGLIITCENGAVLSFGFSGFEGSIEVKSVGV